MASLNTMTKDELAGLLGWSVRTFDNNYSRLVEREGLPRRLPGGRFYAPAIEAWMAARSGMIAAAPADPLAAQRRHLETLFSGRAA